MVKLPIAEADIVIFQGGTFDQVFFYETGEPPAPVNLSGYTAKMQIRSKPESKAVILELSTEAGNNRITLNYASNNGAIRLFISAADTAQLSPRDEAVYNLVIYNSSNGTSTPILQGKAIIVAQITR
jgi:hypothetical protein